MAEGMANIGKPVGCRLGLRAAPIAGLLVFACTAALAAGASSQPIPGYYDPGSGKFTPVPRTLPAPPSGTKPVVVSGTLIFKITAKLESSIPPNAQLAATGSFTLSDGTYNYGGSLDVTPKQSGNTATAAIRVPYKMQVLSTSDTMNVDAFIVDRSPPISHLQEMNTKIPLPADGATTVIAFEARL